MDIPKQMLQEVQQIIGDYEREVKAQTDKLVSTRKESCQTYGEINMTLKQIRQGLAWEGRRKCFLPLDEVEAKMDKEDGRLLTASSPSP